MRLPIPLNQAVVSPFLLGVIVVIWLYLELVVGGSTNSQVLVDYGANYGPLVIKGEVWRFFTSMFLHISLAHLAFNGYALYALGFPMEHVYGSSRFTMIYLLTGLFGSLASFALTGDDPLRVSAGASGAIFGVIGMNLAFFWLHKDKFGQFGRAQLSNTIFVIAINLFIGFTMPQIDNMAHIGGLIAGVLLGVGLAPQYRLMNEFSTDAHLVDAVSLGNRWWVTAVALGLLWFGTQTAIGFWS